MVTRIIITCRNNSDARNMRNIPGASSCKHNGGKTVIVMSDNLEATKEWMEDASEVRSYEVTEGA